MGERLRPTEFHAFLDHFYRLATDAIVRHDGVVDKIVGDEVIGLFFGGISGPRHAAAAVAAAAELAETGSPRPMPRRPARSRQAPPSTRVRRSSERPDRPAPSTTSPPSGMPSTPPRASPRARAPAR